MVGKEKHLSLRKDNHLLPWCDSPSREANWEENGHKADEPQGNFHWIKPKR